MRKKRQLKPGAREVRPKIVGGGPQEQDSGLRSRGTAKKRQHPHDQRKRQRRQTDSRPHEGTAGKDCPAKQQDRDRHRRHQTAPQVVEDLPA
jgi:hypothetical protein